MCSAAAVCSSLVALSLCSAKLDDDADELFPPPTPLPDEEFVDEPADAWFVDDAEVADDDDDAGVFEAAKVVVVVVADDDEVDDLLFMMNKFINF
jgi:hypothetical protein